MKRARVASSNQVEEEAEGPDWTSLPSLVLENILERLISSDVVSFGQTCRAWRVAAKRPTVWEERVLEYFSTGYQVVLGLGITSGIRNTTFRHRGARWFTRIIRFAPSMGLVRCGAGIKPVAKKALCSESQCQMLGVDLDGSLAWSAKLLTKWRLSVKYVTLLNPTLHCLTAAVKLPNLVNLRIDHKPRKGYQMPVLPPQGPADEEQDVDDAQAGSVALLCGERVPVEVVESLLGVLAGRVEGVYVNCLPVSLQQCTALRYLAVHLHPESAEDQQRLRAVLQGKTLDLLAFQDVYSERHANPKACKELRFSLKEEGHISLIRCDGVCDN